MESISSVWSFYVKALSSLEVLLVPYSTPYFPVSVVDLINSLAAASYVRRNITTHDYHWLRALWCTWIFTVGGSIINSAFLGLKTRAFVSADMIGGIVIGYMLIFHCPYDFVYRFLGVKALEKFWSVWRGLSLALSVASYSAERVVDGQAAGLWNPPFAPPNSISMWPFLLTGFFGGCGGGLIGEFLNVLRLPATTFHHPTQRGAPAGHVMAIIASVVYCCFLRDPLQLKLLPNILLYIASLLPTGMTSASGGGALALLLRAVEPAPLTKQGKEEAVAMLSIVTLLLVHLRGSDVEGLFHSTLELLCPSFRSIIRVGGNKDATAAGTTSGQVLHSTISRGGDPVIFGYHRGEISEDTGDDQAAAAAVSLSSSASRPSPPSMESSNTASILERKKDR